MNDKWNLRTGLRRWLSKANQMKGVKINATVQGEPRAAAYGHLTPANPAWVAACDGLVASDQALSAKITSVRLASGSR